MELRKFDRKRSRGFTLVELLIVIIIIGILAGSMMLVAGSGTDKANATKIVSDMRTMKSAALMFYADKTSWPGKISDLDSYLDRKTDSDVNMVYTMTSKDSELFIMGTLSGDYKTDGVKSKLTEMAKKDGLYGSTAIDDIYDKDNAVYMKLK